MSVGILVAFVNAGIGLLIGWSGIAGFLLPMFYTGYLGYSVAEALALSFASFFVSGCIGAYNYRRRGELPLQPAVVLSAGSMLGAILGVWFNQLISPGIAKLILFLVVLVSGISIVLREYRQSSESMSGKPATVRLTSPALLSVLGFITGAICALSGAGGPILVMPLLVLLGFSIREAIGMALFNSIIIAIPSFIGYWHVDGSMALLPVLLFAIVGHAIGVFAGSRTSQIIKQRPLKLAVAFFSIAIALYMIGNLL